MTTWTRADAPRLTGSQLQALSERNELRRVYADLDRRVRRMADGVLIADPADRAAAAAMLSAARDLIAGVGERLSREDPAWTPTA